MKTILGLVFVWVTTLGFGQSLPVITASPTNITVNPGSTATFSVTATGATGYQWLFNGTNILGATSAMLNVNNCTTNNCGYYLVLVGNSTGWTPSQMAWLSVATSGASGVVPFSNILNTNNPYGYGRAVSAVTYSPINGSAQIMAGPALDEMALIPGRANTARVTNGWFNPTTQVTVGISLVTTNQTVTVSNVAPGQTVYYSVFITYTNSSIVYTQQSTVITMPAGGSVNGYPIVSNNLLFPGWIEWPTDPWTSSGIASTNQLRVVGETFTLTINYGADIDLGLPYFQWRKNGVLVGNPQNLIPDPYWPYGNATVSLTITNAQPSDAGVYDVDVRGNNWFIGQKIYVSIQTTNGGGVFQPARLSGTNLVCNLTGAPGRNYKVQVSTNLLTWNDLTTLTNVTGTVTFTNSASATGSQFYRTVLLQNY